MFRITQTNKLTTRRVPTFLKGSLIETEETLWTLARRYRGIAAETTEGTALIRITPTYGRYHFQLFTRETTDSPYTIALQYTTN